jgi:hypothetical protein
VSYPNDQGMGAGAIPVWLATPDFNPDPVNPVPATIGAGLTYDTGVVLAGGRRIVAVAAMLDQTGTLTLQRYIDAAGTLPLGSPITQAMTANVLATIWVNDGQPMASFNVTVQNTSGSLGTLSDFTILQSS